MIEIRIAEQLLHHRRQSGVWYSYPISSAARGTGNMRDSLQTPLGRHRIAARIGAEAPPLTAFRARQPFAIFDPLHDDPERDWILSRILRLAGCETGKNRRGAVDTFARYIYIHGTHAEEQIGQPASHGCIRMRNSDIIELFEHTRLHETVIIRP
ncbi:MAG: L,D-transpeptidase [Zetaproteobacteria bacterium CG12_big_fil_rev_8_21_14_0_65_54_13]|nr:MAG: L,D-transpeptidase [Zetaproteobacteria bacterium CG23_combo_of_CG06-09_8_20_14_all_54_7]PIW51272.1 MAG: L,D-transpeptidase [Zetaproteobacteria bacterium CG12_big_fil_rev_8_21_14_0_65_54_13]